ncbi:kinase-like domain-containing protein [Rhizoctonia solani]|nr:kinase-like domain-containing protein [Rhizoctonia solani]
MLLSQLVILVVNNSLRLLLYASDDTPQSLQTIFDLLSLYGCANLTLQMNPTQHGAVQIAGGGFGDIWRGELFDGTQVAVKVWRASLIEQCDHKSLKRATREIYYWSKMKHANVHELMGMILFKGQSLGMVSKWMENGNLLEYLRRAPNADRYQLSIQVASGLSYIHGFSMIHGDVKALNVLVSTDGVAKLTDFGLSTMPESSLEFSATTASQAGSIRWAAPELLADESAKSKGSDVYSLGMTILETFTGNVPYAQSRRDFTIIQLVAQGVLPTRPTDKIQDNERGSQLWSLLVSCWERKIDSRPTAQQVAESLVSISSLGV